VGFPIRKSADQSFFAAPHGLSQRSTSFIASQRQGIHRMPLRHLIALIINTHPRHEARTVLILKDQLASDRSDGVRSSSRQRIAPTCIGGAIASPANFAVTPWLDARRLRMRLRLAPRSQFSERSYLFTMSDSASARALRSNGCTELLRERAEPDWWSQTGSNRRPPACKAGALPTELWPRQGIRYQASRNTRLLIPEY
jgi:hypothetical protein